MSPTRPALAKPLDTDRPTRAKIVATIGPASESPDVVARLIDAGVSVFRLNFSHGDFGAHEKRLAVVREIAASKGAAVAVMGDLRGPKIRVGRLPEGITLEPGAEVVFREGVESPAREGSAVLLPTTYEPMTREVQPGQRVLINDGAIRMLAVSRRDAEQAELRCIVKVGGLVTSGKGINLPDSDMSAPAMSDWDWECVEWSVARGIDVLALSFVRRADEVRELKERLEGMCAADHAVDPKGEPAAIPVIAKIEKPQALTALDEILEAADGIMVARGDLGVEMDLARVPVVQKALIEKASEWGKPCIVATQMLETMIENASPTRAEVSDVANAIFDGADAVMLSGETAVGKHPALVVETMRRVIAAAEERINTTPYQPTPPARVVASGYRTAALADGAWTIAKDAQARCVVCWSEAGGAARFLSQMGFRIPIIAYSSSPKATRRMALLSNVMAVHSEPPPSGLLGDWTDMVELYLLRRGLVRAGDNVVMLAGKPLGKAKVTTTLALLKIGDPASGYRSYGA